MIVLGDYVIRKACPVVLRAGSVVEILAFEHPLAGLQLVKGTVKAGESPAEAALRELQEETGIDNARVVADLGECVIGDQLWSFHRVECNPLPERWEHRCADDGGHIFRFFWHPLGSVQLAGWHADFRHALQVIRQFCHPFEDPRPRAT